MNPLVQSPDAPVRGTVLHQIMEDFVRTVQADPAALTQETLLKITDAVLLQEAPWPSARLMWRARIERIANWFIAAERARQTYSAPRLFEDDASGALTLSN